MSGLTASPVGDGAGRRSAVLRGLAALPARVLADPVRRGRLRDVGWPYGLRGVVALAVVAYTIGAGVVAASGLIRGGSDLTAPTSAVGSLPRGWLWLVLLVVIVAMALFQTAALHLPAWLKIIALITSLLLMGSWGLRYSGTSGLVETVLTVVAMVGLIVLVVLRWRKEFAWWEFPLVWLLLASTVVLGVVALDRSAGALGYDFVPAYLRSTVVYLDPGGPAGGGGGGIVGGRDHRVGHAVEHHRAGQGPDGPNRLSRTRGGGGRAGDSSRLAALAR